MTQEEHNIELSKLKSEIIKRATLKECFFNDKDDECSSTIISAHSLQRMGALARLESDVNGSQKVYALTERQINPDSGLPELKPLGKRSASTFFGFCGTHDSKIFEPVEQNPETINLQNNKDCFLLSFRAFAISYHRQKEDVHLLSIVDDELKKNLKQYFNNDNLEDQLKGSKMGLSDMEPYREILISALSSEDYSCLDLLTYELNYTVPFAMCMLTTPPYLFSGKAINISDDPNYIYSNILTTVIPLETRSIVILAAFKNDPHGSEYLDELDKMYELPFQKALTFHIINNSENCFFSPLWYENISNDQKQEMLSLNMQSASMNTPFIKYNPKSFRLNLFDKSFAL